MLCNAKLALSIIVCQQYLFVARSGWSEVESKGGREPSSRRRVELCSSLVNKMVMISLVNKMGMLFMINKMMMLFMIM